MLTSIWTWLTAPEQWTGTRGIPNRLVEHLGYSVVSLRGMGQTMVDDMRRVFVEKSYPEVLANRDIDLAASRITRFRR